MMTLKTQAVQLGGSYMLPVHILYRNIPGRLGGDSSFADAIIAKYTSADDQELPSADFVFPKFGESDAASALTELSNQLILMNRIRIQMNIRNYQIMQRYSLTVSARCDQILNELQMRANVYAGVSQASVRELMQIHRELKEQVLRSSSKESFMQMRANESPARLEEENTLILRILTAASRGNGTRERYMRQLVNRMQSIGIDESPDSYDTISKNLLRKAEAELFQLPERESGSAMMLWRSEAAKQFFWRIQRTPEPFRSILLETGGFSSLVTFEKVLKNMDTDSFRAFAKPFIQRISDSFYESSSIAGGQSQTGEYGDEDWLRLYHNVENSTVISEPGSAGPSGRDGLRGADGSAGFDGLRGADGSAGASYHLFDRLSEEEWNTFRTELVYADQAGELKNQVPELYRALTEEGPAETEKSAAQGVISTESASPAVQDVVSTELTRGEVSTAGNVSSRLVVENILNTMDRETFHTVVRPLLQRVMGNASLPEISEGTETVDGGFDYTEQSLRYATVERVFAALEERTVGQGGATGPGGRDGARGAEGLGGRDGAFGAEGLGGRDGARGAEGLGGRDGAFGAEGLGGRDGARGAEGPGGRDGAFGAEGLDGHDGARGTDGYDGRDGLHEQFVLSEYTNHLLERQSEETWELFCSGLIYADREGELRKQMPELYQALNEGREPAGHLSSREAVETILNRLDQESFHTVIHPLLQRIAGTVSEAETAKETEAVVQEPEGSSQYTRYREIEHVLSVLGEKTGFVRGADGQRGTEGYSGRDGLPGLDGLRGAEGYGGQDGLPGMDGLRGAEGYSEQDGLLGMDGLRGAEGYSGRDGYSGQDGLSEYTERLFEQQSEETWELFCSELIYADQGGELKEQAPELYRALVDGRRPMADSRGSLSRTAVERIFSAMDRETFHTVVQPLLRQVMGPVPESDNLQFIVDSPGETEQTLRYRTVKQVFSTLNRRRAAGVRGSESAAGRDGLSGMEGLRGAEGYVGRDGRQGTDGLSGMDGLRGAEGYGGRDGRQGADGLSGMEGLRGAEGFGGRDGRQGTDGLSGMEGLRGAEGYGGRDGRQGTDGLSGMEGQRGAEGYGGRDGRQGTDGLSGMEGQRGAEGYGGQDGIRGLDGLKGSDGLHGAEGLSGLTSLSEYTERLFERQSEETWELFCSELIYADREGELREQVPELYQALTEGQARTGERKQRTDVSVVGGGTYTGDSFSPRIAVESILRTMDRETFRTVVRPLLEQMTESAPESGLSEERIDESGNAGRVLRNPTAEMVLNVFSGRYDGLPGTEGSSGLSGLPGTEGSRGLSGLPGAEGSRGLSGLPGAEGPEYIERLFERQSEETWELFCSEMVYADRDGELRRQAPDLYWALEEGRIEAEYAADQGDSTSISGIGARTAGYSSSRLTVENIIKTMNRETFRTVVRPLLQEIAGPVYASEIPEEGEEAAWAYGTTDQALRYHSVERAFATLSERSMNLRREDEFADHLIQFFDQHTDEDWELFRSELIYADRDGELKKRVPELYRAFTDKNITAGSSAGRGETGETETGNLPGTDRGETGETETGNLPGTDRGETGETGSGNIPGKNREETDRESRITEIFREKELLYKVLREEHGTLRILRTLIIEAIHNIAVIRENQKEFMTLAESIMNLTASQWHEFKHDVRVLHKEDLDIRELIPETILRETVSESRVRSLEKDVRQTEEHLTQQEILSEGIRMSSEKMELLRVLQKETNRHDTVFTEAGRKIFLNTILRDSDAGRLIKPSFRELSTEGKESWRNFMTELLHVDRYGPGGGNSAGGEYFGKLSEQYGLSNGTEGPGTERIDRREAAIRMLERRRTERILDSETIIERQQEAERIRNTETQIFRLLRSRPDGSFSDNMEAVPEQTSADMVVQRPVPNREAEVRRNTEAALRETERRLRTESSHDIEFETIRHTVSEQQSSQKLKAVSDILDRHEREIAGLLKAQKVNEERNLPREVMKQINDRLRMERLRNGR